MSGKSQTTKQLTAESAFDEGMAAFHRHNPVNPYPFNSHEHTDWDKGYEAASDGAWDAWKSGE
jgi:hypothetical protein